MMVTRFDSHSLQRVYSMEKESSDSDWEEPPICQRMGVMTAFESFDALSEWVVLKTLCVCVCVCVCVMQVYVAV